ncbi:MAG: YczE/YyaS/YitT family protein [Kribbellaceae bacterium]
MTTTSVPTSAPDPIAQLRAGLLPRRLVQLYVGLTLYGLSMALMIESRLGLDPWDVLHYGIAQHLPVSFGTVVIGVGLLVLLAWIPLRQWPGLGTISNAIVIGLVTDAALALLARPDAIGWRVTFLVAGIVGNGIATAMYIGAHLGPGPRDGLMTGLVRRTGLSVRLVRTTIEVSVLAIGWLLGGVVGVGTVAYALAIGPLVHVLLPLFEAGRTSASRSTT